MNTRGGSTRSDSPITWSTAALASASRESAGTRPAATSNGPKRLSGRLDQAISPQPT